MSSNLIFQASHVYCLDVSLHIFDSLSYSGESTFFRASKTVLVNCSELGISIIPSSNCSNHHFLKPITGTHKDSESSALRPKVSKNLLGIRLYEHVFQTSITFSFGCCQ